MIVELRSPFRRVEKAEPPKPHEAMVGAYPTTETLVRLASSTPGVEPVVEVSAVSSMSIRRILGLSELLDPVKRIRVNAGGWLLPADYDDYDDYLEAFNLVPKVNRAVTYRAYYITQSGFTLEGPEDAVADAEEAIRLFNTDERLRQAIVYGAGVFGNYYWIRVGAKWVPVDPRLVACKWDANKREVTMWGVKDKPSGSRYVEVKPDDMIHVGFNVEPWGPYGYGSMRSVLITLKHILYIEKYLPAIARNRADPWVKFTIKDPTTGLPYPKAQHDKVKETILARKPGENITDDGSITVEEVYQTAGVGGRVDLGAILGLFYDQLHAGLGVSEVALASGGTTLKGTAAYQSEADDAVARGTQRELKRFMEQTLWKLLRIASSVSVNWRPLKPDDKDALSARLRAEVKDGIISAATARRLLGYEETDAPEEKPNPESSQPLK